VTSAAVALERVRRRLSFAVRDLEMAIGFYEAARIPHLHMEVQARFRDTDARHTFVALRTAALFQSALAVMRLWDSRDDTASLVKIGRDLRSCDLLDAVAADSVQRQAGLWGASIGKTTRNDLVLLGGLVTRLKEGRLRARLDRLRAYRNKSLAHRDPFENEGMVLARTAEVADVAIVLAASCCLVSRLRLAIDFTVYKPRSVRMIRRRYAEAFWTIPVRTERLDSN
jgi:hypothetical protein